VFDTAFHHSLPETAFIYAIPYQLYRRYRVRRYGFHGTSHRYIAYRYRQLTGKTRESTRILTLHLGNGRRRVRSSRGNPSIPRWASHRWKGSSWARARVISTRR
jgi:acetate kinase